MENGVTERKMDEHQSCNFGPDIHTQDDNKNRLIHEINGDFESISIDLDVTFFDNQSNMWHLIA